jgi:phosphatidylglycerophosphate synthase
VAEVSVDGPAVGLTTQVAVLAVLASGVGLGSVGWLTGVAYAIVVWATLTLAVRRAALRTFGAANWVTLARAILVGGVTALVTNMVVAGVQAGGLHRPGTAMVILIVLSAVALALDGVDGQVARRTGTTSALGARFDMEVDAFLILVLSAFVAESLGPWVLAIGAMRYAFVAAAWALPWLKGDLPPRLSRKAVAALQGVILVVAATGLLPTWATVGVVALALASLCWSFGRDVRWLWRTRRSSVTTGAAGPTTLSGDALHIDRLVHLAS